LKARVLALVLPALVAVAAFAPGLGADFPIDDAEIVRDNPLLAPGASFFDAVSSPYGPESTNRTLWRPLTMAFLFVERRIFGASPVPHQVVNLLINAAVASLVAAVALRLGLRPFAAAVAGFFFGVHPVHAEAVVGIVGRAEILAAAAVLCSTFLALEGFRVAGSERLGLALSASLFGLGVLAKESAATFGLVILVVAFVRGGGRARPLFLALGVHAAVLALVLLLRHLVLGAVAFDMARVVPFLDNPLVLEGTRARVLTALAGLFLALRLLLFPHPLSVDYGYDAFPVSREIGAEPLLGILAVLGLLAVFSLARRRRPAAALGAGFFLATFALTSNLFFPIGTIFGERLVYLPSAGIAIAAAAVLPKGRIAGAIAVAAVIALGIRAGSRSADFRTPSALFETAVEARPRSAKAWHNLAVERRKAGDARGAESAFARAVAILPGFGEAELGLGSLLLERGERAAAATAFRRGAEADPGVPGNFVGLASVAMIEGRLDEAREAGIAGVLGRRPGDAAAAEALRRIEGRD